jgi:hypothetical protein
MKMGFISLLALGLAGCNDQGLTDPGAIRFPVGTYTRCAQGVHNPDGNRFLNGAGFQEGAVLTLTQSGSQVLATYVDQNGATQSLGFSTTTSVSATLARPVRLTTSFSSLCVTGPGSEGGYPASLTAADGTLSYAAGMVFITVTGGLQSDAGLCGTITSTDASFWLLCEDRQGGAVPVDVGPPPPAQLPIGRYACSAQVETFDDLDGIKDYVAGGRSGTLTLAQDRAQLTARYDGDPSLAGTLGLALTTATTARAASGQTLMAPCMVPVTMPSAPEPLPIAAGALSIVGSTLFLSFAGTMAAGACPGARLAGSLICSM